VHILELQIFKSLILKGQKIEELIFKKDKLQFVCPNFILIIELSLFGIKYISTYFACAFKLTNFLHVQKKKKKKKKKN
jgi:hypothetical protein